MLVKTPAIKLGVEVRETKVEDGAVILSGVANVMPCTVVIGGDELVSITRHLLKPAVIGLFLRALFKRKKSSEN